MADIAATVRANLEQVRSRIGEALDKVGRPPDSVQLVGVTKYVDAQLAAQLIQAGCHVLGESRPQELWEKAESPVLQDAQWHLIGHLQRNKVRRTLPYVDLIHSVDSERLLSAIDREAGARQRTLRVLIEVNCSGDAAKHGLQPDQLSRLLDSAANHPNVTICGLMTMAPLVGGISAAAASFAALRELRDRLRPNLSSSLSLPELSMGMSRDYPQAIEHGATILRVGSALWKGIDEEGMAND